MALYFDDELKNALLQTVFLAIRHILNHHFGLLRIIFYLFYWEGLHTKFEVSRISASGCMTRRQKMMATQSYEGTKKSGQIYIYTGFI